MAISYLVLRQVAGAKVTTWESESLYFKLGFWFFLIEIYIFKCSPRKINPRPIQSWPNQARAANLAARRWVSWWSQPPLQPAGAFLWPILSLGKILMTAWTSQRPIFFFLVKTSVVIIPKRSLEAPVLSLQLVCCLPWGRTGNLHKSPDAWCRGPAGLSLGLGLPEGRLSLYLRYSP